MADRYLTGLPPVHPRHEAQYLAQIELDQFMIELTAKRALTLAERLAMHTECIQRLLGYALRTERADPADAEDEEPADDAP